jgi:hypothetical protein
MAFSVTPVGPFPTSTDDGFPQFLQWQDEGIDLGGPDAEVINFVGDAVTATRGTGENEKTVTVTIDGVSLSLQFQNNGDDLGAPDATIINVTGDLTIERTDDTITIGHEPFVPAAFTWRDAPGDTLIELTDNNNGVSCSGTSGTQIVLIAGDTGDELIDLPDGAAVLVYQEGAGGVEVQVVSGVTLDVRAGLLTSAAGQFATLTLLKRRANGWILCGDLAAA